RHLDRLFFSGFGPVEGPKPQKKRQRGASDMRRSRTLRTIAAAVVASALMVACGGGGTSSASEVFLEPATSDGPVPWMGSIADPSAPTSAPTPPPPSTTSTAKPQANVVTAVKGDRAGIY